MRDLPPIQTGERDILRHAKRSLGGIHRLLLILQRNVAYYPRKIMPLPKKLEQAAATEILPISDEALAELVVQDALRGGVAAAFRRLFQVQAPQHIDSLFVLIWSGRFDTATGPMLEQGKEAIPSESSSKAAFHNGVAMVSKAIGSVPYEGFCQLFFSMANKQVGDKATSIAGGVMTPTLAAAMGDLGVLKEMVWFPDPALCRAIDKDLMSIFEEFGEVYDWYTEFPACLHSNVWEKDNPIHALVHDLSVQTEIPEDVLLGAYQGRMLRLQENPEGMVMKQRSDPHKFRLYDLSRHPMPASAAAPGEA